MKEKEENDAGRCMIGGFDIKDFIIKPEDRYLIEKPRPRETFFEMIVRKTGVPIDTVIAVFKRSRNTCEDCWAGPPEVELTFHHLHYNSVGEEQPDDIDHLCWECHKERHIDPNRDYWRDPEEMEECWFGYHWAMAKDD